MNTTLDRIATIFIVLFGAVLCYFIFAVLPVALYNEAECLRAGYPKGKITVGLERYCVTLDGTVAVKVTKQ